MPTFHLPRLFAGLAGVFMWAAAHAGLSSTTGATVITPQVRAELVAYAPQGVAPGQPLWVGLRIEHQPHWHTYWKNPGDSGLPTQMEWTLPAGVQAGEIAWPTPKKLPVGPLVNYGYEDTVLLPTPLTVTPAFRAPLSGGSLSVQLHASWLVCRTECIPQEGAFTLDIPLRGSTALYAAAFDASLKAQPQPLKAHAGSSLRVEGAMLKLALAGLPPQWQGRSLDVFPELAEVLNPSAPWKQSWQGAVWLAELPLLAQRAKNPKSMALVVASAGQSWRTVLQVSGAWPAPTAQPSLAAAMPAPAQMADAAAGPGFWAALAGALLGGLLLNLMPCVFPVLAIKVLSFARHADDRRSHRISGLAYTAGVLVSFTALGLLLLALRAAGASLGWGFQLQDPWVVALLAVLFTMIALNLAGVFEFGMFLPASLAALHARHPVLDAFLTGVLAVAVASPCTAPFMGASLGLAVTLPAPQALLIFASLGLGLASPYLVASFAPAFARLLPQPGPWMDVLRKLLAFPMLLTVVWLVWVLGQQSGMNGAGALLALLVVFSAFVWSLTLSGRWRTVLGAVLLLLGAWGSWVLGPHILRMEPMTSAPTNDARWQAWSAQRMRELLSEGKTVFVDYTAAWCVTCQYNKQTTLSDAQLLAEFDARQVPMLRADWTRRDPAITEALAQLGRSGVPVYVFYRPGKAPLVLSEVLSTREMQQALASL